MKKVKLYGSSALPVSVDLKNKDAEQLNVRGVVQIEDTFFEIASKFQKEKELFINLRSFPNPHLYEKRSVLTLKVDYGRGNFQYLVPKA